MGIWFRWSRREERDSGVRVQMDEEVSMMKA